MKWNIFNIEGEDTGKKIELKNSIFQIEPNDHTIYLDVKQFMANIRQGSHKTKQRSEIPGSTRKIRKQKGTGSARAGSIKSPIFRGGGRAFGPIPKSYYFKLNKKVKQLARKSALSYKAKSKNIIILEDFSFEEPKTKNFVSLMNNLKINDKKSLLILPEQNKDIYLSSRNIQNTDVVAVSELTTYNITNASTLLFVESSVKALEKLFGI